MSGWRLQQLNSRPAGFDSVQWDVLLDAARHAGRSWCRYVKAPTPATRGASLDMWWDDCETVLLLFREGMERNGIR